MLEQYASLPPLPPFDREPLKPFSIPFTGKLAKTLAFSFSALHSQSQRLVAQLVPGLDDALASGSGGGKEAEARRGEAIRSLKGEEVVIPEPVKREVSRIFQIAAVTHLTDKVRLALSQPELKDVRSVVVSGGVASNQAIRQGYVPPPPFVFFRCR